MLQKLPITNSTEHIVTLKKLKGLLPMKKLPESVQREGSLPCSQKPTNYSYSNLNLAYPVPFPSCLFKPILLHFDVRTVHLVWFNIQTNKYTAYMYVYINNILYIVSTATCFDAFASYARSFILLLC